jgi:hypothetical protein
MDDFVVSNLNEARNEWTQRLCSTLCPLLIEGVRSIFNEAWTICVTNDEANKYLMTFQNLLTRVPKWNNIIVEEERKRIIERSGCNYLEDLITCVHIIQLKILTSIRAGNKQKKIDISTPKLDTFIHKVYINIARKVYTNVYLFEKNISPLQVQKHNRELETMVNECILAAVRDSIPTEAIIRAYLDESVEEEEQVFIEEIPAEEPDTKPPPEPSSESTTENPDAVPEIVPAIQNIDDEKVITRLTFNDVDSVLDRDDTKTSVVVPKTIENLEEISSAREYERRLAEEDDDDDRIRIHTDQQVDLSGFDELDALFPSMNPKSGGDIDLDGVEELA